MLHYVLFLHMYISTSVLLLLLYLGRNLRSCSTLKAYHFISLKLASNQHCMRHLCSKPRSFEGNQPPIKQNNSTLHFVTVRFLFFTMCYFLYFIRAAPIVDIIALICMSSNALVNLLIQIHTVALYIHTNIHTYIHRNEHVQRIYSSAFPAYQPLTLSCWSSIALAITAALTRFRPLVGAAFSHIVRIKKS